MADQIISDKVFLEKKERIRIIVQQQIGIEKVIDLIRGKYQAEIFRNNSSIIIFVEEKENEDK